MSKITVHKIAQLTGHKASIYTLKQGAAPYLVLSGAGDGWVVQWDMRNPENGQLLAQVDSNIFSLAYLKDQNRAVVGNMNGGVHWVDIDHPEQTKNIAHHQKGVFDILRIEDSIFTLGEDGKLTRWSATESRTLETFHLSNQSLRSIAYSATRQELAVGASDHRIYFLDPKSLEVKNQIDQAHDNSVFSVQYSPDQQYLLSGGRDAHLKVWDLNDDLKCISSQAAHWFTINHIAIHPKGTIFATASRDKTIKIWDMKNFQLLKVLDFEKYKGHVNSVNKLLWSDHEQYLVSASDDRSLIVWDVKIDD